MACVKWLVFAGLTPGTSLGMAREPVSLWKLSPLSQHRQEHTQQFTLFRIHLTDACKASHWQVEHTWGGWWGERRAYLLPTQNHSELAALLGLASLPPSILWVWIPCLLLGLPLPFVLFWTERNTANHQCHSEILRWILYNPACDKPDWSPAHYLPACCDFPLTSSSPSLLLSTMFALKS